jgi:3-hydroxyisobutyrate dehydrogenase
MNATKPRLGYIGMGLMGGPMTARLLDAGYEVTIWNRSPEKMAPLLEKGAKAADGPKTVAEASDIVMMCLTAAPAVEAVVFGPGGVAEAADKSKVLIDFSSMRPDLAAAWAKKLKSETGMGWLDSPVSGGVAGAADGTLAIMAGGDAEDFDRVKDVVAHMSSRFTHMGGSGSGQITKLCNQIMAGCTVTLLAEMVSFGRRAGIDVSRIPEALTGGWADSKPFQIFVPRMAGRSLDPKLGELNIMVKDLDTVWDVARANDAPVPMTAAALSLMRQMVAKGQGDQDITVISDAYNDLFPDE